mgnify:FL=1
MSSLPVKLITPKMDFGLVSAINKTMDKNIFVEKKPIKNKENLLFNKSKITPKKNKRNLKKK